MFAEFLNTTLKATSDLRLFLFVEITLIDQMVCYYPLCIWLEILESMIFLLSIEKSFVFNYLEKLAWIPLLHFQDWNPYNDLESVLHLYRLNELIY